MPAVIVDSLKGRPSTDPTITIAPSGVIRLNARSAAIFKEMNVERVLVMWDKDKKKISLAPDANRDSRSYRVSYNANGNMASVAAKIITTFIGWSAQRGIKVNAEFNDGMLQAKLPAEYISSSSRTRKRRPDLSWEGFFRLTEQIGVPGDFMSDRQARPPQKRDLFR